MEVAQDRVQWRASVLSVFCCRNAASSQSTVTLSKCSKSKQSYQPCNPEVHTLQWLSLVRVRIYGNGATKSWFRLYQFSSSQLGLSSCVQLRKELKENDWLAD
jgi:hypothetical protein